VKNVAAAVTAAAAVVVTAAAVVVAARADTAAAAVVAAETVATVAGASAVTDRSLLIQTEEQPSPQGKAAFSLGDRLRGFRQSDRNPIAPANEAPDYGASSSGHDELPHPAGRAVTSNS